MDGKPKRTILLTVRYAAAGIGRQALLVALIPVYTLYLDPADFGVLALLTISGTLVMRTLETPLGNALQRFYFRPDYADRRETFLFNLRLFVGVNVVAVLVLYWLAAEAIARLLFADRALVGTVQMHGIVVAFSATTSLTGVLIMLLESSRVYVIASFLNVIVTGLVSVALLVWAGWGLTAVVAGQAAGHLCQTLICLAAVRGKVRPVLDWQVLREPIRFGYATLLSGYSNIVIIAGDRYMLGFLRTVTEVGLYSFGCNIGNLVTLAIGTPVISGVWPTIRRMEVHPDEQRAFVCRVTTFVSLAGIALAVALSVFAPELIHLLAARPVFAAAAAVVPFLAFSQALQGLASFTEAGIVLGNRPAYVSGVALASAAVNIALNFYFIPRFGIVGAGCATLISFLMWNGLNLYLSQKFYQLRYDIPRLVHAFALGGSLVGMAMCLPTTLSMWVAWPLKGLLVFGYPLLLVVTGFLTADEWEMIADLFRGVRRQGIRGMMVALTQP